MAHGPIAIQASRMLVQRLCKSGRLADVFGPDVGRTEKEHLLVGDQVSVDIPKEIVTLLRSESACQRQNRASNHFIDLMLARLIDAFIFAGLVHPLTIISNHISVSVRHELSHTEHKVIRLHDDIRHLG